MHITTPTSSVPQAGSGPAVANGARTFDRPDFDAPALERVTGWIEGARDMFQRAGLAGVAELAPVRIDFLPLSPVAGMKVEQGIMQLGTYSLRDVPTTRSADLVRHEYAHYVLGRTILPHRLASPDAASIHESLADTFAAVLDDDWTMGEELFDDGRVTRSMSNPADGIAPVAYGARPLPAKLSQVVAHDGSHANAGIPSRAAYLIGSELGRERLASLYVDALSNHLHAGLNFHSLAHAVLSAARPEERTLVASAWADVGIPLK